MKAKNTKFCRLGPFPLTDLRILSSCSCFGVFSVHLFTNFHPFLRSCSFWIQIWSACWRVQWQSCNFLCMHVRVFIGPIVSFWPKWAPTSVSGYQIMRPLMFGGLIRGPDKWLGDRNDYNRFWPMDVHLKAVSHRLKSCYISGTWNIATPISKWKKNINNRNTKQHKN